MPISEILSDEAVLRLPPMLFGKIRWSKGLGGPIGNPCSGFTIFVEEHTVSQFRMGPDGPEVIPGTGIWKVAVDSAPVSTAPTMREVPRLKASAQNGRKPNDEFRIWRWPVGRAYTCG